MKKTAGIWRLMLILAPAVTIIMITLIISVVAQAQQELAALLQLQDEFTMLQCEGNYDDTNLDLHIWSEDNGAESLIDTGNGGTSSSAQDVKNGACAWAVAIANDNSFHYGKGAAAHHYGCYFCGTNKARVKKGILDYEKTYCCNPFVHAAFAHGGGEPTMLRICRKGSQYDYGTGRNSYHKSKLFKYLGKPKKANLEKGDVLCNGHHVALYIGDGKLAEASGGDDNKRNSKKWNNSIHVTALTDKRYKGFKRVYRYIGNGGGTMEIPGGSSYVSSGDTSGQFTAKSSAVVLRTINTGTGMRYSISSASGYGVAQSFATCGDKFAVAFTPGPTTKTKGYVRLYTKSGAYLSAASGNLYHANGTCAGGDGSILVAGLIQSGKENTAVKFSVSGNKVSNKGSVKLPRTASSIAYDKNTGNYILSSGSSMTVYDKSFNKKRTVKRSMHGTYYQDIGAGAGCIFACHTKTKGGEKSGKNFIDVYGEESGEYYGSYYVNYGELESADVVDGELVILVHIKGSSKNYIQFTGINMQTAGMQSALIDFRVFAKKTKIGNKWDLQKNDITAGDTVGALNATAVIKRGRISINGTLLGGRMRIKGTAADGKISGSGWMEKVFEGVDAADDRAQGKATYVGVDDTETEHSRKVKAALSRWSNTNNPFYKGYGGLCELWVCDVYRSAGLPVHGACCAYTHGRNEAHTSGAIPKGALIFSGKKRDGSMYENGHRQSAWCDTCHHWAGHVAIYIGGGKVAGSQVPYIMSVDTWIDMFGYGGWSLR